MQIRVQNLSKTYPNGVEALKDITLTIDAGMFGLLGPNGAGKSTFMRILATLEVPTAGEAFVDEWHLSRHRKQIRASLGYLPQFFGTYPKITAFEFLTFMARLNGVPRRRCEEIALQMLENVGLSEARDRKVKTYSGGMLRRLGIAQALLGEPRLLIVDEPTTGLDPEERIRFRNLLAELSRDRVIILSTHIVGDISSTCEDLALLSHGKLVYHGSPAGLIAQAKGKVWQLECEEADFAEIAGHMHVIATIPKHRRLLLRVVGTPLHGYDMQPLAANLEDAYIYFMEFVIGEKLEEPAKLP